LKAFVAPVWFGVSSIVAVAGLAFWKGGREERLAAMIMLWSWMLALVLRDRTWPPVQWGGLLADVIYLAVLVFIALRSPRWWPIFATAFQLLNVAVYATPLLHIEISRWASMSANIAFTQLCMAALAWGCITRPTRTEPARRQDERHRSPIADKPAPRRRDRVERYRPLPGRRWFAPGVVSASSRAR
jgi:hypothetical protein